MSLQYLYLWWQVLPESCRYREQVEMVGDGSIEGGWGQTPLEGLGYMKCSEKRQGGVWTLPKIIRVIQVLSRWLPHLSASEIVQVVGWRTGGGEQDCSEKHIVTIWVRGVRVRQALLVGWKRWGWSTSQSGAHRACWFSPHTQRMEAGEETAWVLSKVPWKKADLQASPGSSAQLAHNTQRCWALQREGKCSAKCIPAALDQEGPNMCVWWNS